MSRREPVLPPSVDEVMKAYSLHGIDEVYLKWPRLDRTYLERLVWVGLDRRLRKWQGLANA